MIFNNAAAFSCARAPAGRQWRFYVHLCADSTLGSQHASAANVCMSTKAIQGGIYTSPLPRATRLTEGVVRWRQFLAPRSDTLHHPDRNIARFYASE